MRKIMQPNTDSETRVAKRRKTARHYDAVDHTRGQELGRWLSPPDPSTNHTITLTAHHNNAAGWFFQGDGFNEWESTPSLLWIAGKPGSGKTVLCSLIIKHVKALRKAGLAYFHFDFRDKNKQSRNSLLRSLLVQLSTQSDNFSEQLTHLHSVICDSEDSTRQPTDGELTRCLKKMLSHTTPSASEDLQAVFLIIDGVDECPDSSESDMPSAQAQVLNLIEQLVGWHLPNLHLCVTSLPEVGKHTALKDLTTLSVSLHKQNGHQEDINGYVKSAVYTDTRMESWSEKDKNLVVETLSKKSDGVFRLTCYQLESLRHRDNLPQDLGRVLRDLPESLDQAYEQILKSIHEANRGHAHRLLQCLTSAIRPLRVEELVQVLAVDFGAATVNSSWRTTDQRQVTSVLSACSSLISNDSQVVQLSHFSVKEFLTSERLAELRHASESYYHITPQFAHSTLSQACLGVLLSLDDHSSRSSLADFPFVQYAANHWGDHIQFVSVSSDPKVRDTIVHFLDGNKPHWKAWHQLRDNHKCLSPSADDCPVPLFYAASYGLSKIVEHLVAKHPEHLNPRGHSAATPLYGALMGNHFNVAKLLCDRGANVNTQDGTKSTLLHVVFQASQDAHVDDVVRWLLNHRADVHLKDENDKTPLHLAADQGSPEAISMLVAHHAKVDAQDKDGRTPLHAAVDRRFLEAVQTLIKHHADVNSRDKKGKTPLHLAVHSQRFDIAQALIELKGAKVDSKDEEGNTPLHVAAKYGEHHDIAQLLIDHKANVDARDKNRATPLHVAVHYGRHRIVQKLVEQHANVNSQNDKGHTPLHVARDRDQHSIAQILLDHKADVNIRDSQGRVAWHRDSVDSNPNYGSPTSSRRLLP